MLAFNLGVFFRNLSGAEVHFTAHTAQCDFQFIGAVQDFRQQQDVGTHLSVALRNGELSCTIEIEEEETLEAPEDARVTIHLVQHTPEGDRDVLSTHFRFEEISLKPHVPPSVEPAEPAEPDGPPPPKAG